MTKDDKELLLKDLCARLPYGVICHYDCVFRCDTIVVQRTNARGKLVGIEPTFDGEFGFMVDYTKINAWYDNIRPYLHPMSSITKEEREEFRMLGGVMSYSPQHNTWAISAFSPEAYDWLNKKMFDFRGLIPKGLALKAPEVMYKNV